MDGVQLRPLTVDVHEPGFVAQLSQENQQPFWFQMSEQDQQQAGSLFGPMDPQGLNRYSYVRNNPVRYVDPNGHVLRLNKNEAAKLSKVIGLAKEVLENQRAFEVKAINAEFSLAMTALGGLMGAAESLLLGLGISITSSFYIDLSHVDPNGTREALDALGALQEVIDDFVEYGGDTTLNIYVAISRQTEPTGSSFCNGVSCHYPTEDVTRYYIRASWGGHIRISMPISEYLYSRFAQVTRLGQDAQPSSGPR